MNATTQTRQKPAENSQVAEKSSAELATQVAAGIDLARQQEIMDWIGKILRRSPEAALVRAVWELTLEPPTNDTPRGWTNASTADIAAQAGMSTRNAERLLPRLVADSVLTDVSPDHPAWPQNLGSKGRLRAPAWGVLDARLRMLRPQLTLPMVAPLNATLNGPSISVDSELPTTCRSYQENDRQNHRQPVGNPPADHRQPVGDFRGGEGGVARARRSQSALKALQLTLLEKFDDAEARAKRRHEELAAHIQNACDGVFDAVARLQKELRSEISALSDRFFAAIKELKSINQTHTPPSSFSLAAPAALRAEAQEKEQEELSNEWKKVARRLTEYGVRLVRPCIADARENGWTPEQVHELLTDCESYTIGVTQAWPPGVIVVHLRTAEPGSLIEVQQSDEYLTAEQHAIDEDLTETKRIQAEAHERFWALTSDELMDIKVALQLESCGSETEFRKRHGEFIERFLAYPEQVADERFNKLSDAQVTALMENYGCNDMGNAEDNRHYHGKTLMRLMSEPSKYGKQSRESYNRRKLQNNGATQQQGQDERTQQVRQVLNSLSPSQRCELAERAYADAPEGMAEFLADPTCPLQTPHLLRQIEIELAKANKEKSAS